MTIVNRFVMRINSLRERRGIPLRLRSALNRLFRRYVELPAFRNAVVFLAAADANQQPTPPNDKIAFITTPRLNQWGAYIPNGAPSAHVLTINHFFSDWVACLVACGYSPTASDPRWRINAVTESDGTDTALFAWFNADRLFAYTIGVIQ